MNGPTGYHRRYRRKAMRDDEAPDYDLIGGREPDDQPDYVERYGCPPEAPEIAALFDQLED